MKKLILLLITTCITLSAFGYTILVDGIYYDTFTTSNSVRVTSAPTNNSYSGVVSIPSTIVYSGKTYSVNEIYTWAFYNCTGLTSITIPSSVTSIGDGAFRSCTGLTSITISSSVTSIGNGAFQGCTGLTSVNYNATNCTTMGSQLSPAFDGCTALSNLNIGSNVKSIPDFAFANYSGLSGVLTIPSSVTSIGNYAFNGCIGLSGTLNIPSTLSSIGNYAFSGCTGLSDSLTIPSSVKSIGDRAFSGCSKITSITIPTLVTSIGFGAFENCVELISVNYNATNCTKMFSNSSTPLFFGCKKLTTLNIGSNVTVIPDYTFYSISFLRINAYPTIRFTLSETVLYSVTKYKCVLFVPQNLFYYYDNDIYWRDFLIFAFSTPIVSSTPATSITSTSVISGGNITNDGGTSVTARGICWSTTANPTISNNITSDGIGADTFISTITGLLPLTTYHARAYATNSLGTAYGSDITFTTQATAVTPILTTILVSSISTTTATSGGTISSDGYATVSARGVCWSTTINPTTSNSKTTDGIGTGPFSSSITGLTAGTTYHVRAYATNSVGTSYGEEQEFTTLSYVDITNTYLTNPGFDINCNYKYNTTATNLATSNGIASDQAVTGWSVAGNGWTASSSFECGYPGTFNGSAIPTLASDGKSTGSGIGVLGICGGWLGQVIYSQNVSLPAGVYKIIYKAYNSSTPTYALSKVGWQTATDSTLSKVTAFPQGVWTNDTVAFTLNSVTSGKIQVGMQSQNSGSSGNARIYFDYIKLVRLGTILPVVTTTIASSIAAKTAISGGNATSNGVATITVRGVCWSTTANPTISNSKTADGTGVGIYTSSITGLLPNTTYHVRAYATNSVGTAYGSDLTFTTLNNTALNNNSIELFNVYPNPTNGRFTLNMESSTANNNTICLLNMLGQKVYESRLVSEKSTINLSAYNFKGVYFLQLHNEKGILQGERKIVFK